MMKAEVVSKDACKVELSVCTIKEEILPVAAHHCWCCKTVKEDQDACKRCDFKKRLSVFERKLESTESLHEKKPDAWAHNSPLIAERYNAEVMSSPMVAQKATVSLEELCQLEQPILSRCYHGVPCRSDDACSVCGLVKLKDLLYRLKSDCVRNGVNARRRDGTDYFKTLEECLKHCDAVVDDVCEVPSKRKAVVRLLELLVEIDFNRLTHQEDSIGVAGYRESVEREAKELFGDAARKKIEKLENLLQPVYDCIASFDPENRVVLARFAEKWPKLETVENIIHHQVHGLWEKPLRGYDNWIGKNSSLDACRKDRRRYQARFVLGLIAAVGFVAAPFAVPGYAAFLCVLAGAAAGVLSGISYNLYRYWDHKCDYFARQVYQLKGESCLWMDYDDLKKNKL